MLSLLAMFHLLMMIQAIMIQLVMMLLHDLGLWLFLVLECDGTNSARILLNFYEALSVVEHG